MISLTCTNCRTVLTIDDAFAGGVCRCQHCGTIQTVPTHVKGSASRAPGAAPAVAAAGQKPQKAIFSRDRAAESGVRVGTGLDELAEIVASSGGFGSAGSGLRSGRLKSSPQPSTMFASKSLTLWLSLAGGVIVVLLVLVLWLVFGRSTPQKAQASSGTPTIPTEVAPLATGPHFCGISLDAPVIIYVLDRGNGTGEVFDTLKEAAYKSIETLGADRKFQVIFWSNGQDDSYPAGLPAHARPEAVTACKRAMEDITAFGQSDPTNALKRAIANKADAIVLVTGKGLELEPALVQQVMQIRRTSNAKIHTVAIGDSASPVLRDIASKTGGEYKTVSASLLRTYAE
ncbi:MAG: VWA domain-containing protein [Burkholderiales bacterium]|nr:VWA domain-containing protein [Phycisphaerae bacterium]